MKLILGVALERLIFLGLNICFECDDKKAETCGSLNRLNFHTFNAKSWKTLDHKFYFSQTEDHYISRLFLFDRNLNLNDQKILQNIQNVSVISGKF